MTVDPITGDPITEEPITGEDIIGAAATPPPQQLDVTGVLYTGAAGAGTTFIGTAVAGETTPVLQPQHGAGAGAGLQHAVRRPNKRPRNN